MGSCHGLGCPEIFVDRGMSDSLDLNLGNKGTPLSLLFRRYFYPQPEYPQP